MSTIKFHRGFIAIHPRLLSKCLLWFGCPFVASSTDRIPTRATQAPMATPRGVTSNMARVSFHPRIKHKVVPATKVEVHWTKVATLSPIPPWILLISLRGGRINNLCQHTAVNYGLLSMLYYSILSFSINMIFFSFLCITSVIQYCNLVLQITGYFTSNFEKPSVGSSSQGKSS